MNVSEANEVGDYKLKRSGEPTGFMKRFRETPLVIVASCVRVRAREERALRRRNDILSPRRTEGDPNENPRRCEFLK